MGAPAHVPFAIVPANIIMSALLKPAERATWQALALHAGGPEKPYARPGVKTLACIGGYSERQVRRALRGLERMGAIALYRERTGCPNEYWLNFSFGVDEERFLGLMQKRQERAEDPADGLRALRQAELDIFASEPEQLPLSAAPAPVPLPELPAKWGEQTPDTQMSAPPDTQMSAKQTSNQQEPHPSAPSPIGNSKSKPIQTEIVISGGGNSLTLSNEDLEDVAECVKVAIPVFDGLMGRPSAPEMVDAALCVPWLGKKFRLDMRGVRAHCLSYARIEAKRHWAVEVAALEATNVVTRTRAPQTPACEPPTDALPEGVTFTDLMDALRTGGESNLNQVLYADRLPRAAGA